MHDVAAELLDAGEVRRVGLVVVVVTGAEEEEPAAVGRRLAVDLRLHRPGVGVRIPVGRQDASVEADVPVDAVFTRRLGQVLADVRALRDILGTRPRLVGIAQREDVAVGPDARIAEEIPRAADPAPALEHRVRELRVLLVDAVGRADPGDPCADDQNVGVFGLGHLDLLRSPWVPRYVVALTVRQRPRPRSPGRSDPAGRDRPHRRCLPHGRGCGRRPLPRFRTRRSCATRRRR